MTLHITASHGLRLTFDTDARHWSTDAAGLSAEMAAGLNERDLPEPGPHDTPPALVRQVLNGCGFTDIEVTIEGSQAGAENAGEDCFEATETQP
jgi:hypothetical protein